MKYFTIMQDPRAVSGTRGDFKNPAFYGDEPFVSWLDFSEDDKLPDFIRSGERFRPVYCISNEMKHILDAYGCLVKAVPVFLTDRAWRSQKVYWVIELKAQECLVQDYFADTDQQIFCSEPEKGSYFFKALSGKIWYPIVSLELAENLLGRHMYGICLYPVKNCADGGGG